MQKKLFHFIRSYALIIFVFVLPLLFVCTYYAVVVSDVFISESKFVIRTSQKQQISGGLGAILSGSSLARTQDESYVVQDFINSRIALESISIKYALQKNIHPHISIFYRAFHIFGKTPALNLSTAIFKNIYLFIMTKHQELPLCASGHMSPKLRSL